MNFVLVAACLIIVLGMIHGFKKGMIEQIVSLISLLVAVSVVFFFGIAITGFMDKKMNSMVIAIIFILLIGFVFKLLNILFMSLKIISGVPVIKQLNKVAGIILGAAKGLIMIWILYLLINYFDLGTISTYIIEETRQSSFLYYLYRNNLLEQLLGTLIINNSYFVQMVSR